MIAKRLIAAAAFLAIAAAPALAQTAQPSTQPAKPAAAAPAAPAAPKPAATAPAAATPAAKKVNLNTATADELDKLPQIGPARSKAIVEARGKTKFKNWDDFVARKVVPANAEAAIKDMVSF